MIKHWHGGAVAVGTLLLFALTPVRADAPGVLWQTTSQMVMEGMPFSPPPMTLEICKSSQWTRPPPPPRGQTCTQSNFQRTGNKISWDQVCTGEMDMIGHGEITFDGPDSYRGTITSTAEGVTMTINLSGKKKGTCDKPID